MKMVVQSMAIVRNKITMPNTVHIAGRGSVVRQLRCENPPRQHVPTAVLYAKNNPTNKLCVYKINTGDMFFLTKKIFEN